MAKRRRGHMAFHDMRKFFYFYFFPACIGFAQSCFERWFVNFADLFRKGFNKHAKLMVVRGLHDVCE